MTLVPDVLDACGFDPDAILTKAAEAVSGSQRRRSAQWRSAILQAWDHRCAFCGYDGRLGAAPVGLDAAHVRWFNFEGPDDLDNGLALCALHHKLLDRGALGLTTDGRVLVSQSFSAASEAGRWVYDLHGSLLAPRPGTALPAARHVRWHEEQVFKGEGLAA